MKHAAILLVGSLGLTLLPPAGPSAPAPPVASQDDQGAALVETLAASGVRLDLERGLVSIPARVLVRQDLLEYLLVNPRGATHESMFVSEVLPSVLNVGLLALGAEPGTNARIEPIDPPPGEEPAAGPPPMDVVPPAGDGFLMYAAWREGEETYLYRVDDLISNLASGRSMKRHRWVFLGSRFARSRPDAEEEFIADMWGNVINISFFYQGDTLVTAALPECVEQTIWVANHWLLPSFQEPVALLFARERIDRLPADWAETLPVVGPPADEADEG